MERPKWVKDKTFALDFQSIKVPKWDAYKDFVMDNGCYVLIKVLLDTYEIAVAVCSYNHEILREYRGTKSQDLYQYIFHDSEKYRWFTRLDHAAYLGKELKKAEVCLALGLEYMQE